LRPFAEPLYEFVVTALVHQQPGPGDAGLPGGGEDPGNHAIGGGLQVGVVEDQLRGFAAQFQRRTGQVGGGVSGYGFADRCRASEGNVVHTRVRDQRLPDRRPPPGDDV